MPARNFDYVNLDLLAVYGEDSGVYSCRAISEFGEATTSCTIKCQRLFHYFYFNVIKICFDSSHVNKLLN